MSSQILRIPHSINVKTEELQFAVLTGLGGAGALLLEWAAADDIADHGDEEGDSEAGHHDH